MEEYGVSPAMNTLRAYREAEARERREAAVARVRTIVAQSMLADLPEPQPGDRIGAHKVHLAAGVSPLAIVCAWHAWP
ncbi:hypothetical protein [Mesorhizobium sp. Z1-4]|uniref:hypothetical protein n=1 Tax=Mesorhizobium sp. Z1-4 TaxID=2448478 RepID=UPI000FDB8457|nr:hypothetical protein [Mesorhizobium sp. Z1-4]